MKNNLKLIGLGQDSFVYRDKLENCVYKVYHEGTPLGLVCDYHRRQTSLAKGLKDSGNSKFLAEPFLNQYTAKVNGDELIVDSQQIKIGGVNISTIALDILELPEDAVFYRYMDGFHGKRVVAKLPYVTGINFSELRQRLREKAGILDSVDFTQKSLHYGELFSQVRTKLWKLGIASGEGFFDSFGQFSLEPINAKFMGVSNSGEAKVTITDLGHRITESMGRYH